MSRLLSRLSLLDLSGIAGIVGLFGAGISLVLINRSRDRILKEDYCVKAFEVLEQNKSAMDLIGSPVKKYRIDLSDTANNSFESLSTKIKVPIKGSKRGGDLFVWADRQQSDKDWTLTRLEIIFNDIKDKKVIVYSNDS